LLGQLAVGGVQLLARDAAGHVIDPERRLVVAFAELVDPFLPMLT